MAYLQDVYVANLNVVCRSGGELDLQPQETWAYREHTFVQNKFYFVTGGRCRLTIEGKRYIGTAGTWFFIPAGTRHSYTSFAGEPLQKQWIHFDLYPNADMASMLRLPFAVTVPPDDPSYILFNKLTEANHSKRLTDRLNAKAYLLQLLGRFVAIAKVGDDVNINGEEEERIQHLLAYVHEHLDKRLGVDELAAYCHLHPTHFIRYFRNRTGQTPARYVNERRMEAAKRLLEETSLPVVSIMEQIGLQEPSHFARLFRKQYALTPTEYRRQFRREEEKNVKGARKNK